MTNLRDERKNSLRNEILLTRLDTTNAINNYRRNIPVEVNLKQASHFYRQMKEGGCFGGKNRKLHENDHTRKRSLQTDSRRRGRDRERLSMERKSR